MLCGVGSGCDRALSHDHYEVRSRDWKQAVNKAPTQRRGSKDEAIRLRPRRPPGYYVPKNQTLHLLLQPPRQPKARRGIAAQSGEGARPKLPLLQTSKLSGYSRAAI